MLIVMAGLPGSGKSTIADALARALGCAVLSVDPVEAAMWRAGVARVQPTGLAAYVVVDALAEHQLALGHNVIVDAVKDAAEAREQWRALAARTQVPLRFIEVSCGDEAEHRRRLRARRRGIAGMPEPSWESVVARRAGFAAWSDPRLVLDARAPVAANVHRAMAHLTDA